MSNNGGGYYGGFIPTTRSNSSGSGSRDLNSSKNQNVFRSDGSTGSSSRNNRVSNRRPSPRQKVRNGGSVGGGIPSRASSRSGDNVDNLSVYSDDVPQFADFDSPANMIAYNTISTSQNNYRRSGTNTPPPPPSGTSTPSTGGPPRSPVKSPMDATGVFDSTAAADSQWAKKSASNIPIPTTNNHHYNGTAQPIPRRPSVNAGILLRSSSIGSISARSVTPVKSNASVSGSSHNHVPPPPPPPPTISARVNSPIPLSPSKLPPQHPHILNNHSNSSRSLTPSSVSKHYLRKSTSSRSQTSTTSRSSPNTSQSKLTKTQLKLLKHYTSKNYTFQNPSSRMMVSIRSVDLASRTAFERIKPVSVEELRLAADARIVPNSNSPESNNNRIKKMSPSPQHVEVLNRIYGVQSARQLCWSPSVSAEADPFYGWDDGNANNDEEDDNDTNNTDQEEDGSSRMSSSSNASPAEKMRIRKKLLAKKRRKIAAASRDNGGRYRQIDPIAYIHSNIPKNNAPPLTNVRRRLPMRSDVGFPRATEEEIRRKQMEIMKEAELEEVSPRLVVLLGSDDVGSSGMPSSVIVNEDDLIHPFVRAELLEYGWEGMPFAGKELVAALYKNRTVFSRCIGMSNGSGEEEDGAIVGGVGGIGSHNTPDVEIVSLSSQSTKPTSNLNNRVTITSIHGDDISDSNHGNLSSPLLQKMSHPPRPNPASVFAPPIDSTFSSTQMWRARPFADRPAGMINFLAIPLDVRFGVGDIEPLVCTLALYCLPKSGSSNANSTRSGINNTTKLGDPSHQRSLKGKISEDFVFPAGDWKGLLNEKAGKILARHFGDIDEIDSKGDDEDGIEMFQEYDNEEVYSKNKEGDYVQKWRRRTKKALFSYDPLALPSSPIEDDDIGQSSLHIVMEVHKVTHKDASQAYVGETNYSGSSMVVSTKKRSMSRRFKHTFGGGSSRRSKSNSGFESVGSISSTASINPDKFSLESKASNAFDAFGTQFLTPVCFGVLPVFPNGGKIAMCNNGNYSTGEEEVMHWPNGISQNMQFYSFPEKPESQDEFVTRLTNMVWRYPTSNCQITGDISSVISQSSSGSLDIYFADSQDPSGASIKEAASFPPSASFEDQSTSSGNKVTSRSGRTLSKSNNPSFRSRSALSKARKRRSKLPVVSEKSVNNIVDYDKNNTPVNGKATFYTSMVGVDFTQCLLQTPEILESENETNDGSTQQLPRLLVDVSGDCAIMMNPDSAGLSVKKRSNLIRLPPSSKPSGYADSFEVKEVLYLPPRNEKSYDADVPISSSTLLNLLYLYPRLIKIAPDEVDDAKHKMYKNMSYSVRIRLVQQGIEVDERTGAMETVYTPLDMIHNPAPGGNSVLQAMYTKIPLNATFKNNIVDITSGLPLRDEIKLRLPDILDGSYFIQFSLFSIKLTDADVDGGSGGLLQSFISETLIPLSSSTTRESSSGARVATIIPNGLHRIKIGKYQLQVETRLASTIHISDPAVAIAVRDFPLLSGSSKLIGENSLEGIGILMSRSYPGQTSSTSEVIVPFSSIFSKASEQAVVNHFQTLVFMHMHIFVSYGASVMNDKSRSSDIELMMENAKSLFVVLRKARTKFRPTTLAQRRQLNKFLKDFLDVFDEALFSFRSHDASSENNKLRESVSSQSLENFLLEKTTDSSEQEIEILSERALSDVEEILLEGAVQVAIQQEQAKSVRYTVSDRKGRNGYSTLTKNSAPFKRKAYGASKVDRMKAEAELYESGQMFTELFDDDETVITAATWQSQNRMMSSANSVISVDTMSRFDDDKTVDETVYDDRSVDLSRSEGNIPIVTPFEKARSMAKRVNSAAQIFIAPCVAPSLSTTLTEGSVKSPSRKKVNRVITDRPSIIPSEIEGKNKKKITFALEKKKDASNSPGSDAEEEESDVGKIKGNVSSEFSPYPGAPASIRLRGYRLSQMTELPFFAEISESDRNESNDSKFSTPFVYEVILTLWLQSWSESESVDGKLTLSETFQSFLKNMDFLLPLCLKSLVLRCSTQKIMVEVIPSKVLDMKHMAILEPLSEAIAQGIMNTALVGNISQYDADTALVKALASSDALLEFFIGLFAIIHPAQVSWLIFKYLESLREYENVSGKSSEHSIEDSENNESWFRSAVWRLRRSRQLRLHAVEKLSSLPRFVALNYPLKYSSWRSRNVKRSWTWTNQAIEETANRLDSSTFTSPFSDEIERLPETHWLAELLGNECFTICSQSCEAIVTQAIAQVKASEKNLSGTTITKQSSIRQRFPLSKSDLMCYQSTACHAITIAYELLIRAHATDTRFQTEEAKSRIAGIFVSLVIENSVRSVQWLAKMDSMHKVRTMWLLCLLYVLQEAPECALREQMRALCTKQPQMKEIQMHRFIRVLKLCNSTFQCFITGNQMITSNSSVLIEMPTWLVQESFNTLSAAVILLVDECADIITQNPTDQRKIVQGVLDLLLHLISTPQSSVTLLRSVGAASHTLDKFGATLFLEVTNDSLQHWARMIFTLMNSTSLSVRSMAVDFVVSLLGGAFEEGGNIDEIALVFLTVLPEVVGREIGLYSISGHIKDVESVETSLWPLRRALADVEETNPLDDDRVDSQLLPFLAHLCRASQAIIDGVLIELRLKGNSCIIAGTRVEMLRSATTSDTINGLPLSWTFDADEESLVEAANFFLPETSPLQRLRWLLTLESLHELKGQWVEAAETLILCARTIAESIPHIKHIWRPSRFVLWYDSRRSPWLSTIGIDQIRNANGNTQVMDFADAFLEPPTITTLLGSPRESDGKGKFDQPTVAAMCKIITSVSKEAVNKYAQENGMESLVFSKLEQLLKTVMSFVDDYTALSFGAPKIRNVRPNRTLAAEENAAMRKMSATINELVTRLAERMLLLVEEETGEQPKDKKISSFSGRNQKSPFYVRVLLLGKKPTRFIESTTIPTFLDWETPYICRVPKGAVSRALNSDRVAYAKQNFVKEQSMKQLIEEEICNAFAAPYIMALGQELHEDEIKFCTVAPDEQMIKYESEKCTYLVVTLVHPQPSPTSLYEGSGEDFGGFLSNGVIESKKFLFKKNKEEEGSSHIVEMTVARHFPCALSRQPTLITTEFIATGTQLFV